MVFALFEGYPPLHVAANVDIFMMYHEHLHHGLFAYCGF
jgi:hypothetical protein